LGYTLQKVGERSAGCGSAREWIGAFLKAAHRVADNSLVQRSTVIVGVLLATSGAMLAGVGFWVSGGFDYLSASGAYDVRGPLDSGRPVHKPP